MSDPNIQKIKEANKEELKRGDIKRTVLQIQDYLTKVEKDIDKANRELYNEIEALQKEFGEE